MPRIPRLAVAEPPATPEAPEAPGVLVKGSYDEKFGPQSPSERRKVYVSPEDRRARMIGLEQLMVAGVPQAQILKACKDQWGMTTANVERYQGLIREQWAKETEADRATLKKLAVKRLLGHINAARAKQQFNAVASLERLLADIQGTKEPIDVTVNLNLSLREAAANTLANMSPEQMNEMIEEQRRLVENQAKPLLVETTGEETGLVPSPSTVTRHRAPRQWAIPGAPGVGQNLKTRVFKFGVCTQVLPGGLRAMNTSSPPKRGQGAR